MVNVHDIITPVTGGDSFENRNVRNRFDLYCCTICDWTR